MVGCPECGANADLTKDGAWAHCASCNTIFEPGKEGSHYRGGGSGSGDKEEVKRADNKDESAKKDVETKN
ncbi:Nn.00g072100.m01.CDS01 [Neocucurbitaria sp. VM-36]